MSDHSVSKDSELDTYQAANLVSHLNKKGLTSLRAIRILKIAALSIELNVCDMERMERFKSELNK